MNEDDFAASDTKMRLIEVTSTSNGVDSLPQVGLTRRAQSDGLRTWSWGACRRFANFSIAVRRCALP
jgi:hypothetical protein